MELGLDAENNAGERARDLAVSPEVRRVVDEHDAVVAAARAAGEAAAAAARERAAAADAGIGVGAYKSRIIAAAIGALAFASVAVLCTTLILPLITVELVVGIAAVGAVVGGLVGWAADALFFSPEERQESENAHGM